MWFLLHVIMDAVKEMKEWLFQKLQSSTSTPVPVPAGPTYAITPKNIPEFVIPGSGDSSRRTSLGSGEAEVNLELKRNSYGGRSIHSSPPGSPVRISPSDSAPCVRMLKGHDLCNSAPVTPKHELRDIIGCRNMNSTSVLSDGTNDDPHSFAAMSLPHFRAQTSFGFSTLSEAPHTRRKESLFHATNAPLLTKKHSLKLLRQESLSKVRDRSSPDITLLSGDFLNGTIARPSSSSMPSVIVTSFAQSSRSGTPSPENISPPFLSHRRLSPTYQAFQGMHNISIPTKHNRFYNRRRSSLVNVNLSESDLSSQSGQSGRSTPSQHSLDLSHEPQRHSSLGEIVLPVPSNPCLKRHSAPQITEKNEIKLVEQKQKPRSSSCHVISKNTPTNHNQLFAPYGELKFSFQYLAASKQLKLTLLKAENLGGQQKQDRNVNPFAKTYLMPGKIQKQTSIQIKRTKNPVFNQDMYFQNISLEDLHSMTLRIKIFSKPHNLKLQEFIGEISIPFDDFDVLVENRMWKDLDSGRTREELGYLGVGLQYDDVQGIVKVHIDQARQLPQHPFSGPPDPYVRVEVTQIGRPTAKKLTSTQKNTANPIFEETFNFTILTKPDDLSSTTIALTIFDHERIRSDDVIGNVILGCMATDVSQYGHWQEAIENPGETIVKWHYLIDTDD